MQCRRINDLLSAYLDAELTDEEFRIVEAHLGWCGKCRAELEGLRDTKRMLAILGHRAPRAEIDQLLRGDVLTRESPLPSYLLFREVRRIAVAPVRPRMAVATIALTLTGMWLASARVGTPEHEDGPRMGDGQPEFIVFPVGNANSVISVGSLGGGGIRLAPVMNSFPSSLIVRPLPWRRATEPAASLISWSRPHRPAISLATWRGETFSQ